MSKHTMHHTELEAHYFAVSMSSTCYSSAFFMENKCSWHAHRAATVWVLVEV